MKLSVTFLGTSSAAPTEKRGLPGIAIQREGALVILDCGEGIQRQLLRLRLGLNHDTTILITHLHGDHVTGLLGLLQTMSLAQRTKPVTIVAPEGLAKWLRLTYETLHIGLTFEIRFVPARPGRVMRSRDFDFRATRADHSIDAFCYVVQEHDRPGVFFPEKARRLGIPEGKLWSRLQSGRAVRIGAKLFGPEEIMGPRRPGRRIGYSGDTRPSKRLTRFFCGCDLLVFDSTFASKDKHRAVERKHSTAPEAARVALQAHARRLVLTHFSARYRSVSALVREARAIFPNALAASDGLRLEVGYPDG